MVAVVGAVAVARGKQEMGSRTARMREHPGGPLAPETATARTMGGGPIADEAADGGH
jgi:hypothetical protein